MGHKYSHASASMKETTFVVISLGKLCPYVSLKPWQRLIYCWLIHICCLLCPPCIQKMARLLASSIKIQTEHSWPADVFFRLAVGLSVVGKAAKWPFGGPVAPGPLLTHSSSDQTLANTVLNTTQVSTYLFRILWFCDDSCAVGYWF